MWTNTLYLIRFSGYFFDSCLPESPLGLDICGIIALWECCGEPMVSDVAELTRTLRKPTSTPSGKGFGAELRSRLRKVSEQIRADLNETGSSIYTDEQGNRYLIQREPGTP
jgi:hypothetical protein